MVARAETAHANGERILGAARDLFAEQLYDQVSLDEVAARAGVTVRTVVRRFGSKEQLFTAVADERAVANRLARDATPTGDIREAVIRLVASYEDWGDVVLHMLVQERRTAAIGVRVGAGRRYHRAWVEKTFSPLMVKLPQAERRLRLAQLTAVTDVYTWKILRRDLGLDRAHVEASIRELIAGIVARPRSGVSKR
jgi:AcrR family transcriptional regulator